MNDLQLTVAAVMFEVGVPAIALVAAVRSVRLRKYAVVVLGALTPAVAVVASLAWAQFEEWIHPVKESMVSAGWVMGFAAYFFVLFGGVLVSFVPPPTNLWGRYCMGLASAPISFGALMLSDHLWRIS